MDKMRERILYTCLGGCATCLFLLIASHAMAQEAEHPAFGLKHRTYISVESEVLDAKKLESKAISILRKKGTLTGEPLTIDEARAKVRVDTQGKPDAKGRTDLARCLEIVFAAGLQGTANVKVTASALANQHPSAPLE